MPIARLPRFFVYTDPPSKPNTEQILMVVDFFGVPPRRNVFSRRSHEASYSTFVVDYDSPFAMHPNQPMLAYYGEESGLYLGLVILTPMTEKGQLKVRRAQVVPFELETKRHDVSPLPMIWIDNSVLEIVSVQGHVWQYDFSQDRPQRTTTHHIVAPFVVEASAPLIVLSMTPDKQHALAQSRPAFTPHTSGSAPVSLYTYGVSERQVDRLVHFPHSTLYSAFIWNDLANFLVEMEEVVGDSTCYQVCPSK